jgi:hypothetical protein
LLLAWIVAADRSRTENFGIDLLPLVVGIAILLWCVRDFYVADFTRGFFRWMRRVGGKTAPTLSFVKAASSIVL